jgi:hypothetical protein
MFSVAPQYAYLDVLSVVYRNSPRPINDRTTVQVPVKLLLRVPGTCTLYSEYYSTGQSTTCYCTLYCILGTSTSVWQSYRIPLTGTKCKKLLSLYMHTCRHLSGTDKLLISTSFVNFATRTATVRCSRCSTYAVGLEFE